MLGFHSPSSKVSLYDYLKMLASEISEKNEHRDVWIESLRSFLQFLRDDTNLSDRGPLEVMFPSKESCKGMELRKGTTLRRERGKIREVETHHILRRIEETVYPVDIFTATEILMNLSHTVLHGRLNSQFSAATALGFAWLCHAVGCSRLVTREQLVFATPKDRFKQAVEASIPWMDPSRFIGVDSLFGVIDVQISKTVYDFLFALPRESHQNGIFNIDLETALRTFRTKGVAQSKRAQGLGKITFLTFMSPPHHTPRYRPGKNLS